jgi:iron complex outermembrane receptor protein
MIRQAFGRAAYRIQMIGTRIGAPAMKISVYTGAALLCATPLCAFAQTTPSTSPDSTSTSSQSDVVQEVLVTAQKSGAQSLQSTPLAIQAFSAEDLKERNVTSIDDLVSMVPGAYEGQNQSVASRSYNLRGAGGSNANGDSPIGYYLDDVPFIVTNFGIAPPVRFIDIEQIEVLRGPQGTLYGQGSSGGVFIFRTRDPNLTDFQATTETEAGGTDGADSPNYEIAGAVSIPIIDGKLAVRVSGGHSYDAGWADDYYGNYNGKPDRTDVNGSRNDDFRIVVLFAPTDNLSFRTQYWEFEPRQQFTGFTTSVSPPYFSGTAGQNSFSNGRFELLSFTATAIFQNFAVTSATGNLKGDFGINIPIAPAGVFSSVFFPQMFAEELRAYSTGDGPLHWLLGWSYQDGQGPQSNLLNIPAAGLNINADNNTLTVNHAFFGELSYGLFDGKLVPLVGLRTYHDDRTFAEGTTSLPSTKNVFTWRGNVSWIPNDNWTTFITAATGFRPGIVQSQVQVQSLELADVPASISLKPETSENYEVGTKWRTPDKDLSVGLNLYQTYYSNLQSSIDGAISGVNGFANFGNATSKGIDYEVQWHTPIKGLLLAAVGNISHSVFDHVDPAVEAQNPEYSPGSRLVNTIDHTFRVDVSYTRSILSVEGFGDVSYALTGNRLQTGDLFAPQYNVVNATFGVRKSHYEFALIGNNLGNQYGPIFVGTTGPDSGQGLTPRTVSLRVRTTFD